MSSHDDPVTIHYTELDGLWKSIAIWGAVGTACTIASPVPAIALALVVGGGLATGSLCAWWIYRMKTGWIDPTRWVGVAILIVCAFTWVPISKATGYLAMGSFFTASISAVLLVCGRIALKKLNQKHARFLQAAYGRKPAPPPPEADAAGTRHAFLAALPPGLRDEMAATFVPVTVIVPGSPSESLAPEASAFGGRPFLTSGEAWPERDGRPMDFLAQINLAEVAGFLPEGAPREGLLAFFYDREQPWGSDPDDLGGGCIRFAPDPGTCVPLDPPVGPSPRQPLRFRRETGQDVPDALDERYFSYLRSLKDGAKDLLGVLHDRVRELEPGDHRLFSAPSPVQDQMDSELRTAVEAYGLTPSTEWIMALQLGSDHGQDWCWGDAGCLYFWLPKADLTAGRFGRPWVVLQCT